MATHRLLRQAASDYREIGRYTQNQWGIDQRRKYLEILDQAFELLAETPLIGLRRDDLRSGVRSHRVEQYIIFYRIVGDGIEIIRLLHVSRDVGRAF